MPTAKRVTTRLVRLKMACETLGIGRSTFWRRWHAVFTDPREPENRRPRCVRRVFEDELAVALESGSAAVLLFRRTMGRA